MTIRRIVAGADIETTGLHQEKGHRIIEVAVCLRDLDTGEKLGKYVQRINPQRQIDPEAQAVHGISFEDLTACPTWDEVAPKLAALLGRCHYHVMHNGVGFDAPFIVRELLRVGAPAPELRIIDTMDQARWATPDGSVPNLGALCFASGVPYDTEQAHGAEYDVEVMLDCFFKHFPRGFFTLPSEPFRLPVTEKK